MSSSYLRIPNTENVLSTQAPLSLKTDASNKALKSALLYEKCLSNATSSFLEKTHDMESGHLEKKALLASQGTVKDVTSPEVREGLLTVVLRQLSTMILKFHRTKMPKIHQWENTLL